MRLDKYLKVSRIIKRRTVANEACSTGRVMINGKVVKPSFTIKEGDTITINFGMKTLTARIENIKEHVRKDEATSMYTILEGEEDEE